MKKLLIFIAFVLVLLFCTPITLSEIKTDWSKESSNAGQNNPNLSPTVLYTSMGSNYLKIMVLSNNLYITDINKNFDLKNYSKVGVESSSTKVLVNKYTPLEKSTVNDDLVNIDSKKIVLENQGLKLKPSTAKALYSMLDSARKEGVEGFVLNSAYRSEASQKEIFNYNLSVFGKKSKTYKEALEKTRLLVAMPGFSEHETGLAVDLFSINGQHRNDFEGTKEQIWLNSNAYKYGFILRYDSKKTNITGATYEPWHFRYTEIPLSTYLFSENLCLEEFYQKIFSGNILEGKDSLFMKVDGRQKVYWSGNTNTSIELEPVKKDVLLLTVKY
ncbi:peptidase M15B and M15C DD-carboxypeptidase VanY/endolysin [Ruminiclostridium papyrosolvens DSM 2782]|uniref:Peptidase M15B and M15C DD-carboxypeptidase VanY/endolysin n=1 Tax=Ruminiclostridium papyrosolvens DSM 2782 TaxID=588581 RepID=F1TCT8_9FIRM|nr:M15 family metallopeptidase [Ruminiclostridium papyrosolvens]EGD47805.1 peptidase M15B and M15C DD-carboxypeptidase VanY/endolysin [Ruminiclostridium papyrosolvens DSM 2782]WES34521.1 M15 family metallopeptidase [Ruminiclostridium papyrosolvens DSM 2782]